MEPKQGAGGGVGVAAVSNGITTADSGPEGPPVGPRTSRAPGAEGGERGKRSAWRNRVHGRSPAGRVLLLRV